jgi:CYTH domain-containing protein
MAIEIERRFFVRDASWITGAAGETIRQGYLVSGHGVTVRVRRIGARAFVTVKGKRESGMRPEFEYEIPVDDAEAMLATLCPHPLVEKTRYAVEHAGLPWHVDVFTGVNAGLVIAECELARPDQAIALPPWVGTEITGDPIYRNSRLGRVARDVLVPGV